MPFPCSIDSHGQLRQPLVACADVAFHRVFREFEDLVTA